MSETISDPETGTLKPENFGSLVIDYRSSLDTSCFSSFEEFIMSHAAIVFLITFGLFLGMLLFLEIGRRIGIRRMEEDAGAAGEGVGATWMRGSRYTGSFQTLRRPKSSWLTRSNFRHKFGTKRLPPACRKMLRLQRRYCYCPR